MSLALALLLAAGCKPATQTPKPTGDPCTGDAHRCNGQTLQNCVEGVFTDQMACPAVCDANLGCVACAPKGTFCTGDTVMQCNPDGTPGRAIVTCVAGGCIGGTCSDPCGKAAAEFSYLGCDYFPTVTSNSGLTDQAHFAVAVANPGDFDVNITVTRQGMDVAKEIVPGGGLKTITLPWVNELKKPGTGDSIPQLMFFSSLVPGGAYKLTADAPVTVYQFNPLEFQTRPGCNPGNPADMPCFTYTNDASLLLPITTLTSHYFVISRPTFMLRRDYQAFMQTLYTWNPGFFSVVGAEDVTTAVTVTFSAGTMAGSNGKLKAYKANQTDTFMLEQGDVLQMLSEIPESCKAQTTEMTTDQYGQPLTQGYCDLPITDLTGTEITADHRVAVFSGHDCTFVPYNRWACDHLEEEMLPVEGWGKDYLCAHTSRTPFNIPDYWRLISAVDGNMITFDPPSVHDPVKLDKGMWVEFPSRVDFEAVGTGAFEIAQYMAGENWGGSGSGGGNGDPAMSLAVPIEQYRSTYLFLTPASYTQNFVNITAPSGLDVQLDGKSVDPTFFKPIGSGKYMAARLPVDAGTHNIVASQPFGIAVYGLAPYTSYMYPGGLDVREINVQ